MPILVSVDLRSYIEMGEMEAGSQQKLVVYLTINDENLKKANRGGTATPHQMPNALN
jgi:hypothetical protein